MAEKQIFTALLEKYKTMDATSITISFDVEKVFGAKRVPVKVSINNAYYRSTIFRMGKYIMVVPKRFREAAGVKGGEKITVVMRRDAEKRFVEVPQDLARALEKANLRDVFSKLSYSHQKEHVNSINEAKKEDTRVRRIEKQLKN